MKNYRVELRGTGAGNKVVGTEIEATRTEYKEPNIQVNNIPEGGDKCEECPLYEFCDHTECPEPEPFEDYGLQRGGYKVSEVAKAKIKEITRELADKLIKKEITSVQLFECLEEIELHKIKNNITEWRG